MLTKDLSIAEFDFHRRVLIPDRLHRRTHQHYLSLADQMLELYQQRVGEVRKVLHEQVRRMLQAVPDCPTRRIGAFCKLLDDASAFQKDKSGVAAKLRKRVFTQAALKHPLVVQSDALFDNQEATVKQSIASELGIAWPEIQARLFADVIEFHRLLTPPQELDGAGLLAQYNVAQTQAALYSATSMKVWAKQDFKAILRFAKLARLMHSIHRDGDGYLIRLNGEASIIRTTKRYGVAFATFLPGLLSARDWRMQATVIGPANQQFALRLSDRVGLRSEVKLAEFDSQLEETFAAAWEVTDTGGWKLLREATVLHQGQTVFMPDFTLRHPKHGEVLLEIVGFWTPEYLQEKFIRLQQFEHQARIVLAISNTLVQSIPEIEIPRVIFKKELVPEQLLELLAKLI